MNRQSRSLVRPSRPRRRARAAIALLVLLVGSGVAMAQQIIAHVIAGGGGISHSPGNCRALEGSIAETAVGTSSGAGYTLSAGYWAGPGSARRDSVFRNSFEECN